MTCWIPERYDHLNTQSRGCIGWVYSSMRPCMHHQGLLCISWGSVYITEALYASLRPSMHHWGPLCITEALYASPCSCINEALFASLKPCSHISFSFPVSSHGWHVPSTMQHSLCSGKWTIATQTCPWLCSQAPGNQQSLIVTKRLSSRGDEFRFWYFEAWTKWLPFCKQHLQSIFMCENCCILILISLKFVPIDSNSVKQHWKIVLLKSCPNLPGS